MSDVFGQDISLDAARQARVTASGELLLTDGAETGVQDIILRLSTPLGSLFYDTQYGSRLHLWVHEESTLGNRMALEAEVRRCLATDPRVQPMSATAAILNWDDKSVSVGAGWQFMGKDHRHNLVLGVSDGKIEVVNSDVHPG